MAKHSMGLVLRSRSVEAFHAARTLGGLKLVKSVAVPMDVTDDISIAEAIRQAVADSGLKANRVAVSVPSQDILLRAFTLPLLPKAEWTSAIQFETRKYIPFKMEELVWGYYAQEQRSAKQLAVTFAGIRVDRLNQIRRWLSLAGVKPALVEAQAISLARLARATPPGLATQFVGIVDVDRHANTAHIVIAKDQVPYLSREIILKAEPAATAEAESGSRATAPEGVDPRVEILLSELRLSFDFFVREHPKAIIHQVAFFGDEALVAPWSGWLAQQLPCPVLLGKMSGLLPGLEQFGIERAAAAGLALGELSVHPVKLDFLVPPASYVQTTKAADLLKGLSISPEISRELLRTIGFQAAAAAVAIGLMAGVAQYRLASLRQEMQYIVRAFPDPGWSLKGKSTEELEPIKQQAEKQLEFLRQAVERRVSVTEKMDQLVRVLPEGVWLDGLEYEDRLEFTGLSMPSLKLHGYCFRGGKVGEEMGAISDLVRQVKQNPGLFRGFSVAQLGGISKSHDTQTDAEYQSFQVMCQAGGPS